MIKVERILLGLGFSFLLVLVVLLVNPIMVHANKKKVLVSQQDVKNRIEEITSELSKGFDLESQIKKNELLDEVMVLRKMLASDFFVLNKTTQPIIVASSYANQENSQWTSLDETKREVLPGKRFVVFPKLPLFGSDRTIFINDLPFMFMCSNNTYATVSHFRRGGIIFDFEKPARKTFKYQGFQYKVSWKQGKKKALGVFDVCIEVQKS